jgi:hypothetical protein
MAVGVTFPHPPPPAQQLDRLIAFGERNTAFVCIGAVSCVEAVARGAATDARSAQSAR